MSDILSQVQTASQIYEMQKSAFLTTGCGSVDKCLKGGIPMNSISEERFYLLCNGVDCGRGVCR